MDSKSAIMMSKLKRKKDPSLETVSMVNDGSDFRGIKDGVKDSGPFPTAKTGGSLDILRSAKAGNIGGQMPTIKTGGIPHPSAKLKDDLEGEVTLGPTEVYSPIKKYLKKGK